MRGSMFPSLAHRRALPVLPDDRYYEILATLVTAWAGVARFALAPGVYTEEE
jgi:hypothetical protein